MIGHRGQGFKDLYAKIQPQLQAAALHQATRLSQHLSALGRDGRRHPQSRVEEGALTACAARSRTNGSTCPKRCGKEAEALQVNWGSPIRAEADRREARHRPVRRAHADSQRNVHRHDEPASGHRRAQEKISRRDVHRGRRQLDDRRAAEVRRTAASTCCSPERRRRSRCRRA